MEPFEPVPGRETHIVSTPGEEGGGPPQQRHGVRGNQEVRLAFTLGSLHMSLEGSTSSVCSLPSLLYVSFLPSHLPPSLLSFLSLSLFFLFQSPIAFSRRLNNEITKEIYQIVIWKTKQL